MSQLNKIIPQGKRKRFSKTRLGGKHPSPSAKSTTNTAHTTTATRHQDDTSNCWWIPGLLFVSLVAAILTAILNNQH